MKEAAQEAFKTKLCQMSSLADFHFVNTTELGPEARAHELIVGADLSCEANPEQNERLHTPPSSPQLLESDECDSESESECEGTDDSMWVSWEYISDEYFNICADDMERPRDEIQAPDVSEVDTVLPGPVHRWVNRRNDDILMAGDFFDIEPLRLQEVLADGSGESEF